MLLLATAAVAATWLWPPSRQLWDRADEAVFRAMNGLLSEGGGWVWFWAVTNWRPFDLVAGAAMCAWFYWWWLGEGGRRFSGGFYLAAYGLASLALIQAFHLALRLLEYRRPSPSIAFEGEAILINSLIEGIRAKERSNISFPGDHATVLLLAVLFIGMHRGRKAALLASLTLLPFAVPRLVSGAHWLTDLTVGAFVVAGIVATVWWMTPLAESARRRCSAFCEHRAAPFLVRRLPASAAKWLGIGRGEP